MPKRRILLKLNTLNAKIGLIKVAPAMRVVRIEVRSAAYGPTSADFTIAPILMLISMVSMMVADFFFNSFLVIGTRSI